MLKQIWMRLSPTRKLALPRLAMIFLLLEFYDELVYAIGGAALPVIREDLLLSYAQIGLLLSLPNLLNTLVDPILMLLGDTRLRRALIFGGGLLAALTGLMIAGANSFTMLLVAYVLAQPASSAFVSLAQSTLMDLNPGREPQMMARWSVAGSLGNLIGPLILALGFALAWGWRWLYVILAAFALLLALAFLAQRGFPRPEHREAASLKDLWRNFWAAARDLRLMRWIVLVEVADLLMDIFFSYLPLYLVDVAGLAPAQAGVLVSAYIAVNLLADVALLWLLERVPGRTVIRLSALLALVLYPAFLLAQPLALKIALLLILPLAHLGWYAVLDGEAFAAGNGRSGTVKAVGSFGGLVNGGLVWMVGTSAQAFGLPAAMWLLLLGPLALLAFVPRPMK